MKRTWLTITLLLLLAGGALGQVRYRTLRTMATVRAGYLYDHTLMRDPEIITKLADVGINTLVVKSARFSRDEADAPYIRLMQRWARECAAADIMYLPVIAIWGHEQADRYEIAYPYNDDPCAPCPLESFERLITDRLVYLAELSLDYPIAGAVLDVELYATKNNLVYNRTCGCDHCLSLVPDRSVYLTCEADYESFWRTQIEQKAESCRQAVRAINDEFVLAGYNLDRDAPYPRGIVAGWGTDEKPAVLFAGTTMPTGYTERVGEIERMYEGLPVQLVMGLRMYSFTAEAMQPHLVEAQKRLLGYWLYTPHTFVDLTFMPLPEEAGRYLKVIDRVNNDN